MSLDVSPALLEKAERGEVDEAEFVDCVRTSLPYAWEMISSLVAQLKVDGGVEGEDGDPMAVLEREPDPEVPLQSAAYGVTGQCAQQLAARLLVRGRDLVVGELPTLTLELSHQRADQLPRVRQGGPDAVDEFRFVDLASLGLYEEGR